MTTIPPPTPRIVRCPVCADEYPWPDDGIVLVFDEGTGKYKELDTRRLSRSKRSGARVGGYVRCPNPANDMPAHYLPAAYADYPDPLVVGLVGAPMAGKTHLLTAMIRQAYRGGLSAYGIPMPSALDLRRHENFQQQFVQPFERGAALAGTNTGMTEAADILLVRGAAGERPVTFFDVAGEDLESTDALNRSTRFLMSANAVIFVHALEDTDAGSTGAVNPGWSFELAVQRLLGVDGNANRLPVAIAVTKSDRLRYVPPVDQWLRRDAERGLSADRIRAESRDVYAFLHRQGAEAALRPFDAFQRCTLHFVSASGGDAGPAVSRTGGQRFPRGHVRPAHVLAPLVAILAMTGVITGPEAGKVGMP